MLWSLTLLALLASSQGRVVNISNTWVLPEEGFPVFYRYFRDRISWYEADAVCQFHHANLVTVDTTAQYDAVRAYLKELDITSAVWVGLIRSNPDGDFTWTDYRGLSSDGYWSSAPDARSAPLCAAADPAADYRWEARACGGPMVASFICELPVPQWASGSEGCMVRELPALTILYLPESAAVQLTADCGLAGVKRIQCTGNVKREELLKDLSCGEGITTEITTDVITTEVNTEISQEVNTDENITTESEEVTFEQTLVRITPIPYQLRPIIKEESMVHRIPLDKDVHIIQENNLESNDIPKYGEENNFLSEEETNKLEDEKHMAHKQLHNDLARLGNIGNFDTIFSQLSDHFVPPLVMAKAKISDDMTVLSLEEKHAQQIAEQHKHKGYGELYPKPISHETESVTVGLSTVTTPSTSTKSKDVFNKDVKIAKYGSSKKYNEKYSDVKSKSVKLDKSSKYIEKIITPPKVEITTQGIDTTTVPVATNKSQFVTSNDHIIDLTIILKEPGIENKNINLSKELDTSIPKKLIYEDNKTKKDTQDTITKASTPTQTEPLPDMKHEIIEITIPNQSKSTPTIFEVTTKMPVTDNIVVNKSLEVTQINRITEVITTKQPDLTTVVNPKKIEEIYVTTQIEISTPVQNVTDIAKKSPITSTKTMENEISTTEITITTSSEKNTPSTVTATTEPIKTDNKTTPAPLIDLTTLTYTHNSSETAFDTGTAAENHEIEHEEIHDMEEIHDDELHSSESDEDFQSPLLSAANEPLHRPVRSRRPQQTPNRIKKFNPFRMLG